MFFESTVSLGSHVEHFYRRTAMGFSNIGVAATRSTWSIHQARDAPGAWPHFNSDLGPLLRQPLSEFLVSVLPGQLDSVSLGLFAGWEILGCEYQFL